MSLERPSAVSRWVLASALWVLACGSRVDPDAQQSAGRIAHAVEQLRNAPNAGKPIALGALGKLTCTGPDANGDYSSCVSAVNDVLHPTSRYIDFLNYVSEHDEKEVIMLGILGVPEVTQHNPMPPYEPTIGGAVDLHYRTWQEADVPPEEAMSGVEVEDKVWEFGDIAPGCQNDRGVAIPNTRVIEVWASTAMISAAAMTA